MDQLDQDRVMEVVESDEMIGFCKKCGAEKECVEPDARGYLCDECGENAVYGAEELLYDMI